MNAGKSKVMVGSSGEKMIVNSGKWPCGVGKECMPSLFSAPYVKSGLTSDAVVYMLTCCWLLTVSDVSDVTGQSKKPI